jgi:hypothetical protein
LLQSSDAKKQTGTHKERTMWHHFTKSEALKAFIVAAAAAIAVAGCAEKDAASASDPVVGVTMDSNGKMYVVERKSGKLRVCAYKYETVERDWCKDLPAEP